MTLPPLFLVGVLTGVNRNLAKAQEVISGNNIFAGLVFNEILKVRKNENFIVSPFSAEIILALTQAGAKGETAEEVRNALQLPQNSDAINSNFKSLLSAMKGSKEFTLNTANKIYVKNKVSLKRDFRRTAQNAYQSGVEPIDFFPDTSKAAQTMNKWVEERTQTKIQNLVDPAVLNNETRLVLISAIHFKVNWSSQFDSSSTWKQKFYRASRDTVEVDFMHQSSHYNYYESTELNSKLLEIPFEVDNASFVIILPNDKQGIGALEKQPTEKMFTKPEFSSHYVNVHLPKFKMTTNTDFDSILKNLGAVKIFDEEEADLSGIAGRAGELCLSKVLQNAFIDVSENGIEAAAATSVSVPTPVNNLEVNIADMKDFIADHPFIFYIILKDIILFVGKIVSPEI